MEERHDIKTIRDDANDANIRGLVNNLKAPDLHRILCAKHTGSWMTVQSTTVTGTVLSATDFCDYLCSRHNVIPPNLLKNMTAALSHFLYVME